MPIGEIALSQFGSSRSSDPCTSLTRSKQTVSVELCIKLRFGANGKVVRVVWAGGQDDSDDKPLFLL